MSALYYPKDRKKGYSVQELYDELKQIIDGGGGSRQAMIGPTSGRDDGPSEPLACPITGLEENDGDAEGDVLWFFPGEDEFFTG